LEWSTVTYLTRKTYFSFKSFSHFDFRIFSRRLGKKSEQILLEFHFMTAIVNVKPSKLFFSHFYETMEGMGTRISKKWSLFIFLSHQIFLDKVTSFFFGKAIAWNEKKIEFCFVSGFLRKIINSNTSPKKSSYILM